MSEDKDIWKRIRRAAKAARLLGQSEQNSLRALVTTGKLMRDLEALSDRQIGQLMFDVVWDVLDMVSPAFSISAEASERLFRSPSGSRDPDEVLNDPDKLPDCPICGQPMMRYIGIGEPDYLKCVTVGCGHRIVEPNKGEDQR